MRPTTKDLAKAAGVSLATVDRVLNNRPGVRRETVDSVTEAIERIGFVRNQSAANLARGRSYRFEFLLPKAGDDFMAAVIDRIRESSEAFRLDSIEVSFRCALPNDPHKAAELLARISPERIDGVAIMAPESPQVRDATTRLIERGVRAVQFISGQHDLRPIDFVGVDNDAAGATAARLLGRFLSPRTGKILVVSETMNSLDSVERRLGFDRVLTTDFPGLIPLPSLETFGDAQRTRTVVRTSYANHPDIVGAYVLGSEARLSLEAIREFGDPDNEVIIAHERTRYTEEMLRKRILDAVIAQNPGHLVRSAIRLLKARCDGREPLASQEQIRIEVLIEDNLEARCPDLPGRSAGPTERHRADLRAP
ncbi:LacI family DNA-binding transcriptional regulator [Frigidibacter sp.]|uniref:LacI family DNA-binding transcriptional regulator n=1 Tax=Frigidibacter sp. TaxID=2586418 RepID=UPI002734E134|nr:LacI family DNA-binding transcriptional regulator [Frigidibacter sp.]MDP3339333.1 LacI family DNA-binding transcriptional regulator [Frigidibacter sp.]